MMELHRRMYQKYDSSAFVVVVSCSICRCFELELLLLISDLGGPFEWYAERIDILLVYVDVYLDVYADLNVYVDELERKWVESFFHSSATSIIPKQNQMVDLV